MAARTLINVPAKGQARRGHRDQVADLAHHGKRLPPRQHRQADPARHHHLDASAPTTARRSSDAALYPAISGQSVHHLLYGRDRERHDRVQMDRRQRIRRGRLRATSRSNERCRDPATARAFRRRGRCALAGSLPQLHAEIPLNERRSGYEDMSARQHAPCRMTTPPIRRCCRCSTARRCGSAKAGSAGKSCADCHGDATAEDEGRLGALSGVLMTKLEPAGRSRAARQPLPRAAPERDAVLVREQGDAGAHHLSRPAIARRADRAADDPRLAPFIEQGRAIYNQRQGQLNLSCGQCHDDNWGKVSPATTVPQGHPTGYPIYRLEWQSVGSLQRRLRNCLIGMRAEPIHSALPEHVNMELYLMWRARGMKVETPAVRP